jgi:signal transduction histidine kinase/ActR/RegA family two-component response regulator
MKVARFPFQLSFQARVLVPVVAVVIVVVGVTLWMLNKRVAAQFEADAAQALLTSDAVFQNSQKIRAKNLFLRYGSVPNEPRFKAVAQLGEGNTMRFLLRDLVTEMGAQFITYTTWNGEHMTVAHPNYAACVPEFQSYAIDNTGRVLQGQTVFNVVTINGHIIEAVSIPVVISANTVGVLTFGAELGDDVAHEFHQLTRCEVVFFANGRITAATLKRTLLRDNIARALVQQPPPNPDSRRGPTALVQKLMLGGEHTLCVTGQFKGAAKDRGLGYALLTSYEEQLDSLRAMQHTLLLVGFVSVSLATLVVWGAVRRITQPLRQLRDVAVAIGKGDFSQRVDVRTADECGQLANAFNRMTSSLAAAREQLEQTVETLRSTRAQLTQSEKLSAVGEFVAGVTHELNNPLTSVIGFAELLQQAKLDGRHHRQVDMIARESHRCHRIVQSLLSFARQHKPERKPTKVNEALDAALDILAYQMRTSNIEVERRLSPELPAVIADEHQLQQVFINILNNSRQAVENHRPDGWIGIATRVIDGQVEISFCDNGPGISEENLAKIFDPFFTTKEVGKGTGLGLSLCYGIIQEHGGTIHASSKPGEGATFTIALPVAADIANFTQPIDLVNPSEPVSNGTGKRVLVVDDEEGILKLAHEVLSADNYRVDIASDGETALRKVRDAQYDVIVCDWKMPGLNGRQVYERLCASNPEAAQRFIFMTGDLINDNTRAFLDHHSRTCLSKPFSLSALTAAISRTLDAARN